MWEYIEKTRDMVHDLEKRVQSAKDNVESMSQLMTEWAKAPLYERKEGKHEGLLNLEVSFCIHQCSQSFPALQGSNDYKDCSLRVSNCSDFLPWKPFFNTVKGIHYLG